MFISLLFDAPEFYIAWVVVVMFSICVHECCHAWTAYRCGDSTAVDRGFLTLNPLVVMGPFSLGLLAFFGIAWGAVPVTPSRLRGRYGRALVAASGPGSNIGLLLIFFGLFIAASQVNVEQLAMVGQVGMMANGFLFLFNMLPVPGLDGWDVYELLIPAMRRIPQETRMRVGWILLLVILFTGAYRIFWSMSSWLTDSLTGLL